MTEAAKKDGDVKDIPPSSPAKTLEQATQQEVAKALSDEHMQKENDVVKGGSAKPTKPETNDGVIIRDTRRKRWTLTGALKDAMGNWFAAQKNAAPERAVTPAPAAAPESHAASKEKPKKEEQKKSRTSKAPVIEKLRTYEKDVERATHRPFSLKRDGGTDWTHFLKDTKDEPDKKGVKQARPTIKAAASATDESDLSGENAQKTQARIAERLKRNVKVKSVQAPPARISKEPVPYGYADIAPTMPQQETPVPEVPEKKEMAKEAREEPEVPETPRSNKPVQYGYADIAPTVPQAETPTIPEAPAEPELPVEPQEPPAPVQPPVREISVTPPAVPPATPASADVLPKRETSMEKHLRELKEGPQQGAAVRTYRSDAIADVERNQRSVPEIAAAEARKRARTAPQPARKERSGFPYLLASVFVLLVAIGAATGYLIFTQREEPAVVLRIPSFIGGVNQVPIAFSTDRETLMSVLTMSYQDTTGRDKTFVQLYPSEQVEGALPEPIPTPGFMEVFDPRASGSFIRSLEENMMFGAYLGDTRAPFFIFKTNQFDTALAGMIGWEANMSADLSPIFGDPVRRSFDPTSRTIDETRGAQFIDETIRNTNVRILYDELGEERILYAFVGKDTIVITATPEALVALIEVLR